jgi:hypothetical protein
MTFVCENCGERITEKVKLHNKGYCDECAYACWGEEEPDATGE